MRALIVLHRWLGVAFCLLFAMWFLSGIVMHFVPFPALSEAERIAVLLPIDPGRVMHSPVEAVAASEIGEVMRVRLMQRSDGPIYVVSGPSRMKALAATDLGDAAVRSVESAAALALPDTGRQHLDAANAPAAVEIAADQWTVAERYDPYRPLYRMTLADAPGTERYLSATTGEIVLETTRRQRGWNYAGSVLHWIYPAPLRSHPALWSALVWWVALLATIGAGLGALIGMLRIEFRKWRPVTPYRGWQAWHHWLGLASMMFVLTWIFSGWLSLDSGQLFSSGVPTAAQARAIAGKPHWENLPADELQRVSSTAKEVEWFAFGGRVYRRERSDAERQLLFLADNGVGTASAAGAFLRPDEVDAAVGRLALGCNGSFAIAAGDDYPAVSPMPRAPVLRAVCGADWFDIDGSNGAVIARLDRSRRVYRWLYGGLHRLDFPILTAHPALRTGLIAFLCGCGFLFSVTAIVIAARRVLSSLRRRAATGPRENPARAPNAQSC